MSRKNIFLFLTIFLPLVIMGACHHKSLCDGNETARIRVQFEWDLAPDADPKSMGVYFFPEDGGEPFFFQFTGREGGYIEIPPGNYSIITVNTEEERNFIANSISQDKFRIHTQPSLQLGPLNRNEIIPIDGLGDPNKMKFSAAPDYAWGAYVANENLEGCVDCLSDRVIILHPQPLVRDYDVLIKNVENLKYCKGISFSISNMTDSLRMNPPAPMTTDVSVPFYGFVDKKGKTLSGKTTVWGPSAKADKHILVLYVELLDGRVIPFPFDVTEQVRKAPDPFHVHIIIDHTLFKIPKPITNGNGFDVDVDDWSDDVIELPIYTS